MNSHYGPIQLGGDIVIYGNTFDISAQESVGNAVCVFNSYHGDNIDGIDIDIYMYRNTFIGNSGDEANLFCQTSDFTDADVRFYNNIIKGFTSAGESDFQMCEGGTDRYRNFYVYHNTFYGNTAMNFADGSDCNTPNVYVKNNIWNTWGTYALQDYNSNTSVWDGNYYYKSGVASSANAFTWNGTARSFDYIVGTAGQEANGNFGDDPNLDANGKLQANLTVDPDVNAHTDMSSWPNYTLDIDGTDRGSNGDTWDIGASQYTGQSNNPPSPPTALTIIP